MSECDCPRCSPGEWAPEWQMDRNELVGAAIARRRARDTHAETLRVLLLREAQNHAEEGANDMLVSAHEAASFGGTVKHCRTSAGVSYAMAGIALILAALIGGE